MDFVKKNFVTILVVGATVVLAGVAVFTALRLYSLRDTSVTPFSPESRPAAVDAPVGIQPTSGNWNHPETFIVTNLTDEPVTVDWQLDCWDENICSDSDGQEVLQPGQTFEEGLGLVCVQWQLNLNWSGTAVGTDGPWDWNGLAELGPDCDVDIALASPSANADDETPDATASDVVDTTDETTNALASDFETEACTGLAFTLASSGIGGSETPTASPVVTSTPTASATATPRASLAPSASPVVSPTPSATPNTLPDAGIGAPTILGIGFGAMLLLFAIVLAI